MSARITRGHSSYHMDAGRVAKAYDLSDVLLDLIGKWTVTPRPSVDEIEQGLLDWWLFSFDQITSVTELANVRPPSERAWNMTCALVAHRLRQAAKVAT